MSLIDSLAMLPAPGMSAPALAGLAAVSEPADLVSVCSCTRSWRMTGSLILPLALASSMSRPAPRSRRAQPPGAPPVARRVALGADEVAGPPVEVAGDRARRRRRRRLRAAAGAEAGPLEGQGGVGHRPAVVDAADAARRRPRGRR